MADDPSESYLEQQIRNLSINLGEFMVSDEVGKILKTALDMTRIRFDLLKKPRYTANGRELTADFQRRYKQYAYDELWESYQAILRMYKTATEAGRNIRSIEYHPPDTVDLMWKIQAKLKEDGLL